MEATSSFRDLRSSLLLSVAFALPGVAAAQCGATSLQVCDHPNLRVPPSGTAGTTVDTQNFPTSLEICDVDVFVDIRHTFSGDLEIRIASPQGTSAVLCDRTLASPQPGCGPGCQPRNSPNGL